MEMADLEDPGHHAATPPEPDDMSGVGPVCIGACCACTILAVSGVLVYLFCRSAHAPTAVQLLADTGLLVGFLGFAIAAICIIVSLDLCIHGDTTGERQDDVVEIVVDDTTRLNIGAESLTLSYGGAAGEQS